MIDNMLLGAKTAIDGVVKLRHDKYLKQENQFLERKVQDRRGMTVIESVPNKIEQKKNKKINKVPVKPIEPRVHITNRLDKKNCDFSDSFRIDMSVSQLKINQLKELKNDELRKRNNGIV